MKVLTRIVVAALVALLSVRAASAQGAGAWVEVAPSGERFAARMPNQPSSKPERLEAGGTKVSGRRYEAVGDDQTTYTVWSLNDPSNVGERLSRENYVSELFHGEALYLDLIADLAWELLVRTESEGRQIEKGESMPEMSYLREFDLGGRPARAYSLTLKKEVGLVYLCADGPRIYIVAAHGANADVERLREFVKSFKFKATTPAVAASSTGPGAGVGSGTGFGPGRGGNTGGGDRQEAGAAAAGSGENDVDYTRPFSQKEVTKKALLTFKPEPGFTESARKFGVTGVVRLRAILNRTGEVMNISILKGLPHGLTSKALTAVRYVRFIPAQKDGHVVSQYVVFEYNFNIY